MLFPIASGIVHFYLYILKKRENYYHLKAKDPKEEASCQNKTLKKAAKKPAAKKTAAKKPAAKKTPKKASKKLAARKPRKNYFRFTIWTCMET